MLKKEWQNIADPSTISREHRALVSFGSPHTTELHYILKHKKETSSHLKKSSSDAHSLSYSSSPELHVATSAASCFPAAMRPQGTILADDDLSCTH